MKRAILILGLMIIVGSVYGALPVRQDYTNDVSQRIEKRGLTLMQEGNFDLYWTFLQGTTAKDLTNATSVTFIYYPLDQAWSVTSTGTVDDAAAGRVKIALTPAQLATNSSDDIFSWNLNIASGSETLAYAYGDVDIAMNGAALGLTLLTNSIVDWSQVSTYLNTGSGPILPGAGIDASTNGSGQVTYNVTGAGSIVTNITGGTNIVVGGTAANPIINTDGSLQTAIDLNSASNAANTAARLAFTNQSHIFSEDQTMLGSIAVSTNVTATKFSTPSINVSTNITTVQALTQTEIGLENIGVYAKTQPSGAGPFRFYAWSGTDGGLAWYESTAPGVASDKYARWANPSYAGRYENGDGARQVTFEDGTYALNVNSGDSYFGGDVTGASNLTVNGDSNLPDLTVTNSLTLGDDLITNKISVSAVKLDSTWVPDTSNAYDIGSVELPVRGLYVTTITNQDLAVNGDATIESNLVVNGLITLPMGTLIRWETDSTNYIEFGGLSSTQQLMRFVTDGVTSNTYFNKISD